MASPRLHYLSRGPTSYSHHTEGESFIRICEDTNIQSIAPKLRVNGINEVVEARLTGRVLQQIGPHINEAPNVTGHRVCVPTTLPDAKKCSREQAEEAVAPGGRQEADAPPGEPGAPSQVGQATLPGVPAVLSPRSFLWIPWEYKEAPEI